MAKKAEKETASRIDEIMKLTKEKYGAGAAFLSTSEPLPCEVVSTGNSKIDKMLHVGGLPKGRIVEVFGPESCGKTTLMLQTFSQAMKDPKAICGIVDAENSLDLTYAKSLGVDLTRLLISQPASGEEGLDIALDWVRSGSVTVLGIDSVAALVPQAEIEGEIGSANIGLQSRLMSKALRIMSKPTKDTNTLVIFSNQLRSKIGVMYGNPETTSGGIALKYYASIRLDMRPKLSDKIKEGNASSPQIGNKVRIRAVKNKVAPPFTETEVSMVYGLGFDDIRDLVETCIERGIIEKSGSWLSFEGEVLPQGLAATLEYLRGEGSILVDKMKEKLSGASETT